MKQKEIELSGNNLPSIHSTLAQMKDLGEDFEWYPTTNEMLNVIKTDLDELKDKPSVLDCGAGNGKALMYLTEGTRYAIEKSRPLLDQLDKSIYTVGTEFREQQLIDKNVDVIFCNPPYSSYVEWMIKIIREANANHLYFIIPDRWRKDERIEQALKLRSGEVVSLGHDDFHNAERKANAKVEIVRIDLGYSSRFRSYVKKDPFDLWFNENFKLDINNSETSKFDWEKELEETIKGSLENELVAGNDLITALESMYQRDLKSLFDNYKAIETIDPSILKELDVNIASVKAALKLKIEGLKDKYWHELFENFSSVTSRLCHDSRRMMLDKLTRHVHVDFNASNAHAIMIWMVKNSNGYLNDQLIKMVESMTQQASISLYKSNERTFGAEAWRYCRVPNSLDRYKLEYRIVLNGMGGINTSIWDHERRQYNGLCSTSYHLINDLITIANNIGFDTSNSLRAKDFEWESNKAVEFHFRNHSTGKDEVLFHIRAFMKGSLHIKFNQGFIRRLNVEFGRLKGWLKDHQDAASELNIKPEEALKAFGANKQLSVENVLNICLDKAA